LDPYWLAHPPPLQKEFAMDPYIGSSGGVWKFNRTVMGAVALI